MNLTEKQQELVRQIAKLFKEAESEGLFLVYDSANGNLGAYNVKGKDFGIECEQRDCPEDCKDITYRFQYVCSLDCIRINDIVVVYD